MAACATAVNNLVHNNIVRTCAVMLDHMELFELCLLDFVVVTSAVMFTFGSVVFLECFRQPRPSPLGFTKRVN